MPDYPSNLAELPSFWCWCWLEVPFLPPVSRWSRFQAQRGQMMLHSQPNTYLGETPALPWPSPCPARAAHCFLHVQAPGGVRWPIALQPEYLPPGKVSLRLVANTSFIFLTWLVRGKGTLIPKTWSQTCWCDSPFLLPFFFFSFNCINAILWPHKPLGEQSGTRTTVLLFGYLCSVRRTRWSSEFYFALNNL